MILRGGAADSACADSPAGSNIAQRGSTLCDDPATSELHRSNISAKSIRGSDINMDIDDGEEAESAPPTRWTVVARPRVHLLPCCIL